MSAVTQPRAALTARGRPGTAGVLWYTLLAVGLAVGLVSFTYQWLSGLQVTGLSNTVSWGMYIVLFMFLVGVSAGGLIVVAGSELVGSHRLDSLNRIAVIVSGTAIAAAALSIFPDLGRPQLFWKMIVQPNWTSPLMWDMVIITVYLTIAAVDLWILTRPTPQPRALRIMAMITLPVAVLVHSITAWIFGLLVARPWWNTALIAPMFITSALVSGTALVLLVAYLAKRTTRFNPPDHVFGDLAKLMVWFIGADAFMLSAELLTTYTSRMPDHIAQLEVILFGRLAPVFWGEVALGVVVPFVIFAVPGLRARRGLLLAAAVLALAGVFFKRVNILMPGLFEPLVGLAPGIPAGRPGEPFTVSAPYVPTWVEWGIVIGILAFTAALITLGIRLFVEPRPQRAAPAEEPSPVASRG